MLALRSASQRGLRTLVGPARYVHTASDPVRVLVLGGGVSGLAYTHVLARALQQQAETERPRDVHILLLEASDKLGGWIQTARHESALMRSECGPRALSTHGGLPGPRGDSAQALGLLNELGLEDDVVTADAAAAHRYIYEPSASAVSSSNPTALHVRGSLVEVTPSLMAKRHWAAFAAEPFKPALASDAAHAGEAHVTEHGVRDETLAAFVSRRFSPRIAAELADPGLAGVYAGRADRLSARAALPAVYFKERIAGSLLLPPLPSRSRALADAGSGAVRAGPGALNVRLSPPLSVADADLPAAATAAVLGEGKGAVVCRPPAYFFGPRSALRETLGKAAGAPPVAAAPDSLVPGRFLSSAAALSGSDGPGVGGVDWYEGSSPILLEGLSSEKHLKKLRSWRRSGLVTLRDGMHTIPASLAAALAGGTSAQTSPGSVANAASAGAPAAGASAGVTVGSLRSHAEFPRSAQPTDPLWRLLAGSGGGAASSKGVGKVVVDVVTGARVLSLSRKPGDASAPIEVSIAPATAAVDVNASQASGSVWRADYIFSTLPSPSLAPLLSSSASSSSHETSRDLISAAGAVAADVRSTNVWVVTVGFSAHQTTSAAAAAADAAAASTTEGAAGSGSGGSSSPSAAEWAALGSALAARPRGFGFLVPSSAVPASAAPDSGVDAEGRPRSHPLYGLLGVVFDSDTFPTVTPTVTSTSDSSSQKQEKPLLMTIMVGGDRFPEALTWSKCEVLRRAREYISTVLGIPFSVAASNNDGIVPAVLTADLCRQCIPQPSPGHTRRVQGARAAAAGAMGVADLRDAAVKWVDGAEGAGWDPLLATTSICPTVPLSLDTLFVTAAAAPAPSAGTKEGESLTLGSTSGRQTPTMASTLLQSAGLVHPRLALGGTMVTGPAVKDLIREARFAGLRLARHIRAREAVEAAAADSGKE